jgi:hypothetical protein
MLSEVLTVGRDPIFGLTPGELIFGAVIIVAVVLLVSWAWGRFRNL